MGMKRRQKRDWFWVTRDVEDRVELWPFEDEPQREDANCLWRQDNHWLGGRIESLVRAFNLTIPGTHPVRVRFPAPIVEDGENK